MCGRSLHELYLLRPALSINISAILFISRFLRSKKSHNSFAFCVSVVLFCNAYSICCSNFYTLNILRSNGIKGQITEELQVKHYTQSGIAGRSTSGGITCEYKGDALHLSTTRESEKLYKIYGDSVISHIKVRLALKETLPYVYYVDDALITYSEFYLKYIFGHPFSSSNTRKDGIPE